MSKLDSALLASHQLEDPALLELPRGVRLMHVEALCWSALHKTDGQISKAALRRLTDEPNVSAGADSLAAVGLWEVTDTGWQIVDRARDQLTAAGVERIRDANRERMERWTQCRLGDHSKCRHNAVTNGATNGVDNERLPDSTRPDSTRLDAAKPHIEAIGQNGLAADEAAAVLCAECGEADGVVTWREGYQVCEDCHVRLSEPLREDLFLEVQRLSN